MLPITWILHSASSVYRRVRRRMRSKWQRDLPLDEMMFDRWERARSLGFGRGASIYHNSYVYGDVSVGEDTWIGPFTLLDGSGGLEIGRSCSISAGVHIYSHDTVKWAISGGRADYECAPVTIGDCCFIGPQAVIAKGIHIGSHSVVGANSFVNSDVPERAIAVGTPCKLVGRVVEEADGRVRFDFNNHSDSGKKKK